MEQYEEKNGWGLEAVVLIVALCLIMFAVGLGLGDDGGGRQPSNQTTRTEVNVLSNNDVRIFSPETHVTTDNSRTTNTTDVEGDRNILMELPPGTCWLTSANSWGQCPPGATTGETVP
jgi:hypothetical protein